MIIEHIVTAWLRTVSVVLALTPSDRWAAAKKLNTDSAVPGWFIWSVGIILIVLVISALVVTYKQISQRIRHTN